MTVRGWREVADEVFVRSYDQLDINICVVRGGEELLLVDSRSSPVEAAELADDLAAFAPARVQVLVNTHAHFDHTFGNQQFAAGSPTPATIIGHHRLPAHLDQYERPRLAAWGAGSGDEPDREWETLRITPPTQLVDVRRTLQIDPRSVELQPLGPGHTDTDLVVHVPDARCWVVGDVVEASGPPMYGSGCFPLQHPHQMGALLAQLGEQDVVVPGHGPLVDRAIVEAQLAEVVRFAPLSRKTARKVWWSRGVRRQKLVGSPATHAAPHYGRGSDARSRCAKAR